MYYKNKTFELVISMPVKLDKQPLKKTVNSKILTSTFSIFSSETLNLELRAGFEPTTLRQPLE